MREQRFLLGTGLLLLTYYLIFNVIMELRMFDTSSDAVFYGTLLSLIFLEGVGASCLLYRSGRGRQVSAFRFRWSYLAALFVSLVLLFSWIFLATQVFHRTQNGQAVMETASSLTGWTYILVRFVYTCLLGPITEEVVFRGLVMTALAPYRRFYLDVLVSSCLFSLIHVLQHGWVLTDFITYFGFGLILGGLLRYTRSLAWPLAAHILWNTFLLVVGLLVFGY